MNILKNWAVDIYCSLLTKIWLAECLVALLCTQLTLNKMISPQILDHLVWKASSKVYLQLSARYPRQYRYVERWFVTSNWIIEVIRREEVRLIPWFMPPIYVWPDLHNIRACNFMVSNMAPIQHSSWGFHITAMTWMNLDAWKVIMVEWYTTMNSAEQQHSWGQEEVSGCVDHVPRQARCNAGTVPTSKCSRQVRLNIVLADLVHIIFNSKIDWPGDDLRANVLD